MICELCGLVDITPGEIACVDCVSEMEHVMAKFPSLTGKCQWCQRRLEPGTRDFIERLCIGCRTPERTRLLTQLRNQRQRAWRHHADCTLTLRAWAAIVDRFNGQCAYCGERPWEVIEHVIPIAKGGGTTVENCVPACATCNRWKGSRHPETISDPRMDRVHAYLAGRKRA